MNQAICSSRRKIYLLILCGFSSYKIKYLIRGKSNKNSNKQQKQNINLKNNKIRKNKNWKIISLIDFFYWRSLGMLRDTGHPQIRIDPNWFEQFGLGRLCIWVKTKLNRSKPFMYGLNYGFRFINLIKIESNWPKFLDFKYC